MSIHPHAPLSGRGPFYSNCFSWAWRMRRERGGYIVATGSLYGWWLHCFWTADFRTFWQFTPCDKQMYRQRHFPPLFFRGEVTMWVPPALRAPTEMAVERFATTLSGLAFLALVACVIVGLAVLGVLRAVNRSGL